jgi:hypothetical protein
MSDGPEMPDRTAAGESNGRPQPEEGIDLASEEMAIEEVRRAVSSIEFGSVLIKIHEGEVVGIETSKKVRLKGVRPPR